MYRIDGIYNSGYAHAPALIVNPSGSYPLIYNSTTGILQQTPNDQKVDKASDVEFTSVKTATVKSLTGTDAALIDSTGSIFAQNGLWSEKGVQISDLSLKKTVGTSSAYEIKAIGVNDKLAIYSTKGVSIGFANNNFLFEPASATFPNPSFRIPSGASMWTSKIYSVTGQSAITIADNGTVSIPSLTLPDTAIFKTLEVSNLPYQTGKFSITQINGTDYFYIKTTSFDGDHSLDIWATSIRNRSGTGGLLLDNNSSLTTFLAQVNNFTYGVYLNNNIFSDNKVNRLWYDPTLSNLNLQTTGLKLIASTETSQVELSEGNIFLASKVGGTGPFINIAAFSSTGIDFNKNVSITGTINATQYYKNLIQVFPPNQACDTTSNPSFVSVDATTYKLNGAAITFPTQALNTTSSPTFAGLTTTPVSPSLKAPILTTSTEGAPTNSNPNGNGADLDVFDLRIRSGRLFTSAATLQLGKKFSCDKQFNITGNNAPTTGETPYVTLRGAVQLQIGTTNFPNAILVADNTGIVTIKDLQATNTLEVTNTNTPMRALGGVNAVQQSITGGNLFANVWQSNPPETGSFPTQQAVATSTGPNFTNGIRVNNIKRPDGTQTFIDMNGTQPSFPLGLTATSVTSSSIRVNDIMHPTGSATLINFNGPRPYFPEGFDAKLYPADGGSEVTYNAAVNTFGYKPRKPDPAVTHIRFAQNAYSSFLDNADETPCAVQTWYYQKYLPRYPDIRSIQFGGNRGYPPLIDNAQATIDNYRSPNIYFSFEAQTPFESTNFPNTWQDHVKQKFPSLGTYMITWNIGSLYDPRRVLLSINKNFVCSTFDPIDGAGLSNMSPAANDPTALTVVENYTHTLENGTSLTAIVNITSLNDYVTYTMYNYDARTFLAGQGRNALSVVKVGQL
jgi:hypothetical protein